MEYVGLRRIAQRMGYKAPQTAARMAQRDGLPIYQRVTGKNQFVCVIDDQLILAWQLQRAQQYRESLAGKYRKNRLQRNTKAA